MIGRHQPPVATRLSPIAIARAALGAHGPPTAHEATRAALARRYDARHVLLLDSGTSALALALGLATPSGGVVAMPGYACIDLAAAAQHAGVRVVLYDLDPATLGPDLSSLETAFQLGATSVVVVHLFGMPVAMDGVSALAHRYGATVIEDAAQAAGGSLAGRPLGGQAPLSVLSFGRGKGMAVGTGGALLVRDPRWDDAVERLSRRLPPPGSGLRSLLATAAQWALGRPALYAVPSALPGLRLGEMVYHPLEAVGALPHGAARLLDAAVAAVSAARIERAARAARAARYAAACEQVPHLAMPRPVPSAEPGWLRCPVRRFDAAAPAPRLGIVRPYTVALADHPAMARCLTRDVVATPAARALARELHTLPTHHFVTLRDERAVLAWAGRAR